MKKRMSDLISGMEQYVNDLEEEIRELEEQLEDIENYYLEEIQEYEMCSSWLENKVAQLTTENAFLEKENAELRKKLEKTLEEFYKMRYKMCKFNREV